MGNTQTKESGSTSVTHSISNGDSNDIFTRVLFENSAQASSARQANRKSSRSKSKHHGPKPKPPGYEMIREPNENVDGGLLYPQGIYQGDQDFKISVVRDAIMRRKMAPFYKGLDSVEPQWTEEELLEHISYPKPSNPPKPGQPGPPTATQMIWLYRNVHECPICFLVYPRLNATRCCGQFICTECFVQIKRNPPHPPYTSNSNAEATDVLELLSEPAACPYCAQPDLGILFEAPPFEWGITSPSEKDTESKSKAELSSKTSNSVALSDASSSQIQALSVTDQAAISRKRRTSVPASHPSVITVDMIRPDWEEKLASARRRLARKSAAARALHNSALLPRNQPRSSSNSGGNEHHHEDCAFSHISQETQTMSSAQIRALEKKMIQQAIEASLSQR